MTRLSHLSFPLAPKHQPQHSALKDIRQIIPWQLLPASYNDSRGYPVAGQAAKSLGSAVTACQEGVRGGHRRGGRLASH